MPVRFPVPWRRFGVASATLLLAACREDASSSPRAAATAREPSPPIPAAPTRPALPPLDGATTQTLHTDVGQIVVLLPADSRAPRPVVVALHGMDALPEWVCGDFHAAFARVSFVVCPAGDRRTRAHHTWSSPAAMRRASAAALAALEQRWPEHVAREGRVLATYSLSASLAPAMLGGADGPRFDGAFFYEGFSPRIDAQAPAMARAGLRQAIFFPTQAGNRAAAEKSAQALVRHGVRARVSYPGHFGHYPVPAMRRAFMLAAAELVQGLPAWPATPPVALIE